MACIFCLLPLFLIPIVNILPLLFYYIMGKIYGVFGWEYRKPVRVPPACPYRPTTKDVTVASKEGPESEPGAQESVSRPTGEVNAKQE